MIKRKIFILNIKEKCLCICKNVFQYKLSKTFSNYLQLFRQINEICACVHQSFYILKVSKSFTKLNFQSLKNLSYHKIYSMFSTFSEH